MLLTARSGLLGNYGVKQKSFFFLPIFFCANFSGEWNLKCERVGMGSRVRQGGLYKDGRIRKGRKGWIGIEGERERGKKEKDCE